MAADTGVSAPGADGHMPKVRWGEGVCRPQGGWPRMGVLLTGVLKAAKPAGPLHAGPSQLASSRAPLGSPAPELVHWDVQDAGSRACCRWWRTCVLLTQLGGHIGWPWDGTRLWSLPMPCLTVWKLAASPRAILSCRCGCESPSLLTDQCEFKS